MIAKAFLLSDGTKARLTFLQGKVEVDDKGNDVVVRFTSHRECQPTRESAVAAAKSVGVDLSRETYTETGSAPTRGTLALVGVFGAPPALPKTK